MAKEIIDNLSRSEKRWLDLAANLAKSYTVSRYKHGAVIVKGGRIISTGVNKIRNHPDLFDDESLIKKESHVHAEIDAIKKVSDLRGAKIYIARINRSGQQRLSRPCDNCYNYIVDSGITKIVYT